MKIRIAGAMLLMMIWAPFGMTAAAADVQQPEIKRVEDAAKIIKTFTTIPEKGIPPTLLRNAQGIAVFPDAFKVGFIIGGNYGRGVLSIRDRKNHWTNPVFVTMAGGSLGWQIGAQSADIILVFKTRKSIDEITAGKVTLGADASVAVGPVGRQAAADTDTGFQAEIYSYSRTRGLFAGVSVQGAALEIDYDAIVGFYHNTRIGARDIFDNPDIKAPQAASEFRKTLSDQTR